MLYVSGLAVAAFAAAAVGATHPARWAGTVFAAVAVLVTTAVLTGLLGRNDRLTLAGAALAAWAGRVSAEQPPGITEPGRLALLAAPDGGPPVPVLGHIRRGAAQVPPAAVARLAAIVAERLAERSKTT